MRQGKWHFSRRHLVMAVGLLGASAWLASSPFDRTPEAIGVEEATVTRRDIDWALKVVGKVEPLGERPITTAIAGRIERFSAEAGDRVKRGQEVARLSGAELEEQLQQARHRLEDARLIDLPKAESRWEKTKIELTEAQNELALKQTLFDNQAESRLNLETAKAGLEKAKLEVKSAEQEIHMARLKARQTQRDIRRLQERMAKLVVCAPADGLLTRRRANTGDGVGLGVPLFDLADDHRIVAAAPVNELDAVRLKAGQRVSAVPVALGDVRLTGYLDLISPIADKGQGESNTVMAKAILDRTDPRLRPGSSLKLEIVLQSRKGVTCLPIEAIVRRDGKPGVFVADSDGRAYWRPVKTGLSDFRHTEVTLPVGHKVVYSQGKALMDGLPVTASKKEKA